VSILGIIRLSVGYDDYEKYSKYFWTLHV